MRGLRQAASPWDTYEEQLGTIAQDPDPVSQNWDLAHMQDPEQSAQPLQAGSMWNNFNNLLRHRGALMGTTIGFNPHAQAIAQGQGAIDNADQQVRQEAQRRRAVPTLAGLRQAGK